MLISLVTNYVVGLFDNSNEKLYISSLNVLQISKELSKTFHNLFSFNINLYFVFKLFLVFFPKCEIYKTFIFFFLQFVYSIIFLS